MGRIAGIAAGLALWLGACAGAQPAPESRPRSVALPPQPTTASPAPLAPSEATAPGTRELVRELEQAERTAEPTQRWHETRRILAAIRALSDPRGADTLATYVAEPRGWPTDPERVHRRTQAAFALAELGDLRALPVLAARLGLDPLTVYRDDDPNQAGLRRSDEERVIAARLIADLAVLHPAEHERIRREAQQAVRKWLEDGPQPHANGLRALARMQVQDGATRQQLLAWADPPGALPKPGAMPPFEDKWLIAQSALRYTGALRDPKAWSILDKQLARRPAALDLTMDSIMNGGLALVGMTVRALGIGAASGFAEWGDARAVPLLLRHIDDDKQNEGSQDEACRALGATLDAKHEPELTKRLAKWRASKSKGAQRRVACLLEALRLRSVAKATPALLELTDAGSEPSFRMAAARALGYAGLDGAAEQALLGRLGSAETRPAAAVALLLGGSVEAARRAAEPFSSDTELAQLREDYSQSLDVTREGDLESGRLFRFVRNARALTSLVRGQAPVDFALRSLAAHFGNVQYDAGPRSLTRVVLRKRLFDLARSGPDREAALDTLEVCAERGVLLALATGSDATAKRAAEAAARLGPVEPR